MTPYLLISLGCAVCFLLGFGEGFRRGQRKAEREQTAKLNYERTASFQRGEDSATSRTMLRARPVLDAFPTSMGGRAMFRAIGGDPGRLPRKKAVPDA